MLRLKLVGSKISTHSSHESQLLSECLEMYCYKSTNHENALLSDHVWGNKRSNSVYTIDETGYYDTNQLSLVIKVQVLNRDE